MLRECATIYFFKLKTLITCSCTIVALCLFIAQSSPCQEYKLSWEVRFPQDIVYDQEQQLYFVAYLTGNPMQQHGSSYISKVSSDLSQTLSEQFCVNLNNPQALALSQAFLIVADQGSLKFFDRKSGFWQKTLTFGSPQESLISDVVFDGDRFVYACDMFGNALIRIDLLRNLESTILDHGPWLKFPRRLLYNPRKKTLFVASYHSGTVYEFNPQTKTQQTLLEFGPTQLTGMEIDKELNLYLANDHEGGTVTRITPRKEYALIPVQQMNPANLALSSDGQSLLLPSLSEDTIFQIPFGQIEDQALLDDTFDRMPLKGTTQAS